MERLYNRPLGLGDDMHLGNPQDSITTRSRSISGPGARVGRLSLGSFGLRLR